MDSCIRGYHVYKEVWTAVFGEELYTEREFGNVVDRYAVTVMKDSGETGGIYRRKSHECVACLYKKVEKYCV